MLRRIKIENFALMALCVMAAVSFQDIASAEECLVPSRTQLDAQIKKMREDASRSASATRARGFVSYLNGLKLNVTPKETCAESYLKPFDRGIALYKSNIESYERARNKAAKALQDDASGKIPLSEKDRRHYEYNLKKYLPESISRSKDEIAKLESEKAECGKRAVLERKRLRNILDRELGLAKDLLRNAEDRIAVLEVKYKREVEEVIKDCSNPSDAWMNDLDLVLVKASEHPVIDPRLLLDSTQTVASNSTQSQDTVSGNLVEITRKNAQLFFTPTVKDYSDLYLVCRYPMAHEMQPKRDPRSFLYLEPDRFPSTEINLLDSEYIRSFLYLEPDRFPYPGIVYLDDDGKPKWWRISDYTFTSVLGGKVRWLSDAEKEKVIDEFGKSTKTGPLFKRLAIKLLEERYYWSRERIFSDICDLSYDQRRLSSVWKIPFNDMPVTELWPDVSAYYYRWSPYNFAIEKGPGYKLLMKYISTCIEGNQCEDNESNRYIKRLHEAGVLDIQGDGVVNDRDVIILASYLSAKRIGHDFFFLGNVPPKATRTTANEIISFIKSAKLPEE